VYGLKGECTGCPNYNSGFLDALIKNDILSNFVGHDHKKTILEEFIRN